MPITVVVLGSAAATAAALSAGLCRLAMATAHQIGFLDRPGTEAHKQQTRAVPYGGGPAAGLALILVLAGAWAGGLVAPTLATWAVAGGALVLFAVGLRDDARALSARAKLLAQAVVAAVVVPLAGLGVDSLAATPALAFAVAWAWLILVCNAYNLVDHADGISATIATISAVVLAAGNVLGGNAAGALPWCVLAGVLLGFLWWNRPPARIYLGDAGSLPMGFLIGVGTLSVTFWPSGSGGTPLAVLAPLLITAVPLFDTAVVVVKRLRRERPILRGDRNHISHRLGRLGLSPGATWAVVAALQGSLAVSVLQLRSGDLVDAGLVLAQAALVLLVVVLLETTRDRGV
jgi:UDP-GlcNAc:undecaprenyl-phosphate/decaprenyl-phosphate GlcNAc-1-phosphate transferase